VAQGVVTLTGTVGSWAKRMAAHRVAGVPDVANDIQIKPPGSLGRTDTEITQAVRRVLECDAFVPEQRIQSTISNGVVTLAGTVDFWSQREDAARAVRNLMGVRGVNNMIRLGRPKFHKKSATQLKTHLHDTLNARPSESRSRCMAAK
jgi:osmotically-inducible protein OsmY